MDTTRRAQMHPADTTEPDRQPPVPRRKLLAWLAVAVVLGVGVMVVLFDRGAGAGGIAALRGTAPLPLLLAVLAAAGSWLLTSASLMLLGGAAGFTRPMRRMWPAYMAGNFCGLVTPFGSGGTPGQAYFVSRLAVEPGPSFAIAASRGLISSTIIASAAAAAVVAGPDWLPQGPAGGAARAALGIVAALLLAATLLVVSERPGHWIAGWAHRARGPGLQRFWTSVASQTDLFRTALRAVGRRPGAMMAAALCEVASWILIVAVGPLVLLAIGWDGPAWIIFLRVVALFMVVPMSPTPGSAGTAELGFFVIGQDLVPNELMVPAVLLWRLIMYYMPLAVGGAAVLWFGMRSTPTESGVGANAG